MNVIRLEIEVLRSITGKRVIAVSERLRWQRGLPKEIVMDNVPEFIQPEWSYLSFF